MVKCLFSSLKPRETELFHNEWEYVTFHFSEHLIVLKYSFPGNFFITMELTRKFCFWIIDGFVYTTITHLCECYRLQEHNTF